MTTFYRFLVLNMEDSGPRGPNGSVHTVDLSESKELCIDVTKNKAIGDPVACEAIIEDKPGKIIRKLSGVGGFDEDAKVLLSKIAEALGLDVLDKVSEKLTNGTRVKETSLYAENNQFDVTLDYIEESIDNMCNRGASKKPNHVKSQLAETLKGFAEISNKSVYTDQMTRIVDKLTKKYRQYNRLRNQYQFMVSISCNGLLKGTKIWHGNSFSQPKPRQIVFYCDCIDAKS